MNTAPMEHDLFFELQQWRQWLKQRPRFATEVIVEFVARARQCQRLDQTAFSAAVFEAIWDRQPEAGQRAVAPTRRQGVPSWVLPLLVRGLSSDQRLRFPSLPMLLDALEAHAAVTGPDTIFVSDRGRRAAS